MNRRLATMAAVVAVAVLIGSCSTRSGLASEAEGAEAASEGLSMIVAAADTAMVAGFPEARTVADRDALGVPDSRRAAVMVSMDSTVTGSVDVEAVADVWEERFGYTTVERIDDTVYLTKGDRVAEVGVGPANPAGQRRVWFEVTTEQMARPDATAVADSFDL